MQSTALRFSGWVIPYQGIIEPISTVVLAVLQKANSRNSELGKQSLVKKRQQIEAPLISSRTSKTQKSRHIKIGSIRMRAIIIKQFGGLDSLVIENLPDQQRSYWWSGCSRQARTRKQEALRPIHRSWGSSKPPTRLKGKSIVQ